MRGWSERFLSMVDGRTCNISCVTRARDRPPSSAAYRAETGQLIWPRRRKASPANQPRCSSCSCISYLAMALMQALVESLETKEAFIKQVPVPQPTADEILVNTRALALNPVDSLYLKTPISKSDHRVIGCDFAGVVVAVVLVSCVEGPRRAPS